MNFTILDFKPCTGPVYLEEPSTSPRQRGRKKIDVDATAQKVERQIIGHIFASSVKSPKNKRGLIRQDISYSGSKRAKKTIYVDPKKMKWQPNAKPAKLWPDFKKDFQTVSATAKKNIMKYPKHKEEPFDRAVLRKVFSGDEAGLDKLIQRRTYCVLTGQM